MNTKSDKEIQDLFMDLLSINSVEDKVDLEKERLHYKILSEIERHAEEQGLNRKELAKKAGTSASYITQLFKGTKILNLEMWAKLEVALGIEFEINSIRKDGKQ